MIENELKRMFPGIAFHHLGPDKLKGRDERTRALAQIHNAVESNYSFSQKLLSRYKTARQVTETLEELSGQSIKGIPRKDVKDMEKQTERSWKLVLATNRDLPKTLRAKHTR